jgi:superfamily II DNA or RNA helicase
MVEMARRADQPKPLDGFQNEAVDGIMRILREDPVAMLVAPTGAGKTGIVSRVGRAWAEERDEDVLILVHRRNLLEQMALGRAGSPPEVPLWSGLSCGTIADSSYGGIDQNHRIVVGMLQTVAAMIRAGRGGELKRYGLVAIDEAHHATAEASAATDRDGDYVTVMDHFSEAKLLPASATPFTSAGDGRLDPRLESARRHTVTYQEAIAAGRIVPTRTTRPQIPMARGMTVERIVGDLLARYGYEGMRERVAGEIEKHRNETFWAEVVAHWQMNHPGRRTIWFLDSREDMAKVEAAIGRWNAGRNAGARVGFAVVGAHRTDAENRAALADYAAGRIGALVSCRMIGEGFNVPETDLVIIANRCTTRGWYSQMVGRAMRAGPGKTAADVIDLGATTYVFGLFEEQIARQSEEMALAAGVDALELMRRMEPDPAAPGWARIGDGRRLWYVRANGNAFDVIERDLVGDRRNSSGVRHIVPANCGPWTAKAVSRLVLDAVRDNDWLAAARSTPAAEERHGDRYLEFLEKNRIAPEVLAATPAPQGRGARAASACKAAVREAFGDPENARLPAARVARLIRGLFEGSDYELSGCLDGRTCLRETVREMAKNLRGEALARVRQDLQAATSAGLGKDGKASHVQVARTLAAVNKSLKAPELKRALESNPAGERLRRGLVVLTRDLVGTMCDRELVKRAAGPKPVPRALPSGAASEGRGKATDGPDLAA